MASKQDVYVILSLQFILFVLFCIFGTYSSENESEKYAMFQDVHVMIFIGFGFLMTFLRRYGFSAVGFNFLLAALIVQWAIICQGLYELDEHFKIEIGIESLYKADIAAATVLISMGAVLGRTSFLQLLLMGIIEIAVFSVNAFIGDKIFMVSDAGGSIFVHTFGAYFGLAVSYLINKRKDTSEEGESMEESRYTSDLFAMIGTIFLWLFWPSFNAIELESGDEQQRAIINTYLSLAACCVTTFAFSLLYNGYKFDMVHIQNSTLAGGVAVGTAANLMLQPYGAILVGIMAAILSVIGYAKITPFLARAAKIKDTCGVHNLHGMPGVFAGIIGAIMASIASESMYKHDLFDIYPAMSNKTNFVIPVMNGDCRTSGEQALYQFAALVVTILVALVAGSATGAILMWNVAKPLKKKYYYDDKCDWHLPQEVVVKQKEAFPNSFQVQQGSI